MIRLGIEGALLETAFSTNPLEPIIENVREHSSNMKRWPGEEVAMWSWMTASTRRSPRA